jgi:hypothetical protein
LVSFLSSFFFLIRKISFYSVDDFGFFLFILIVMKKKHEIKTKTLLQLS